MSLQSEPCPCGPARRTYWYNNATNGLPGLGRGGFQVPATGDKAHKFVAPNYATDIRGPCPGLNAMANHNFLAHDGIVTFNELVDAQQNVYNVGCQSAAMPPTGRLSIPFSPARSLAWMGITSSSQTPRSLATDYFPADGDNYKFNGTLFGMMTKTTGANYNLENLALYRYQRYQQSLASNPNFYFGPLALLLYGAASFLYELMPSGTHNYAPDYATISSFFGATKSGKTYVFNGKERIPKNWTNRVYPYTGMDVGTQILAMYSLHPVLFGGNTGDGTFDVITTDNGMIVNGTLTTSDPKDLLCFLYQLSTERFPSSLNGFVTPTVEAIEFALTKLGPQYANLGCPMPLSKRDS